MHIAIARLLCLLLWLVFPAQSTLSKEQPPTATPTATTNKNLQQKWQNCFSYLTNLPGEKFYFDKKNVIYALVNSGVRDKLNFQLDLYKHVVMKINMNENSMIIIKELTASMPSGVVFMPYGNPPSGWSGVLFEDTGHTCRRGKARFFDSAPRGNKKISAFEKNVVMVASLKMPRLFDIVTRRMLDTDVQRSQFRKLPFSVPEGEIPLYSDPLRRTLYTFAESPDFRGIVNHSTRNQEKLSFPPGTRVLQQGRLFAVSEVNRANNTMEIREYSKWSGIKAAKKRYRIKLPHFYNLVESQAVVDFRRKIIVIGAAVPLAKEKWRKVFFVDYRRGKQLAALSLRAGLIADTIASDPFGMYIAINVLRASDGKTVYLALFDLRKRKLHKLSLRPTVRSKKKKT